MSEPVAPLQASTAASSQDPNSITNLLKQSNQQKKQATADTVYDTKGSSYENFTNQDETLSIITSFLIAAGILAVIGAFLPKKSR